MSSGQPKIEPWAPPGARRGPETPQLPREFAKRVEPIWKPFLPLFCLEPILPILPYFAPPPTGDRLGQVLQPSHRLSGACPGAQEKIQPVRLSRYGGPSTESDSTGIVEYCSVCQRRS